MTAAEQASVDAPGPGWQAGPAAASGRAGATAQDPHPRQPTVTVVRIETTEMTPAEYDAAVEALAVLITGGWEECHPGDEAA